mgnify:CR=1 FL=1
MSQRGFLKKYQIISYNLKNKFKITEKRPWNSEIFLVELYVQMGHFAFLLLKKGQGIVRPFLLQDSSVEDELCDITFQLMNLANNLGICLVRAYDDYADKVIHSNVDSVSDLSLILVDAIGLISDCVLSLDEYKDPRGLDENRYKDKISYTIIFIISILFKISYIFEIDLTYSYKKMLMQSESYLKDYNRNVVSEGDT